MFCLGELAQRLGCSVRGDPEIRIARVNTLEHARPGEISFLSNAKYSAQLEHCQASALILAPADAEKTALPALLVERPYLAFAYVSQWLNPVAACTAGIHPSAVVEGTVHPSAHIGPHVYIGADAVIGAGVVVGANTVIERGVKIGSGSRIYSNVTIYAQCEVGQNCVIHAGVVIGADGFGFAQDEQGAWVKVPQLGRVCIGDDVEIGANTCVDRGAIQDTVIATGVKVDNLVQIAHNVRIGEHAIIAGTTGIAGSTQVGEKVVIGGGARIAGHLNIAPGVVISGGSGVAKSLKKAGTYTAVLPLQTHEEWVRNFAHLRKLDHHIKRFEKRIAALEAGCSTQE